MEEHFFFQLPPNINKDKACQYTFIQAQSYYITYLPYKENYKCKPRGNKSTKAFFQIFMHFVKLELNELSSEIFTRMRIHTTHNTYTKRVQQQTLARCAIIALISKWSYERFFHTLQYVLIFVPNSSNPSLEITVLKESLDHTWNKNFPEISPTFHLNWKSFIPQY